MTEPVFVPEPELLMTCFVGRLSAPLPLITGVTLESLEDRAEIEKVARELIWRPSHIRDDALSSALGMAAAFVIGNEQAAGVLTSEDALDIAHRVAAESLVLRYRVDDYDASSDYEEVLMPKERGAAVTFSLAQVISLLISEKDESYWGWNFAYRFGVNDAGRDKTFWMNAAIAFRDASAARAGYVYADDEYDPRNEPSSWQCAQDLMTDLAPLLVGIKSAGHEDTLLYAGDVLQAVSQTYDPRFKLVLLVSIFELLLTHSPDFGRFNVEDSISRQFVLKASVLLREAGERNLDQLRANLRRLYDLRSAIAHGDFSRVGKTLKVPQEREQARVGEYVSLAYSYLRRVLWQFLKDPAYVAYLKVN